MPSVCISHSQNGTLHPMVVGMRPLPPWLQAGCHPGHGTRSRLRMACAAAQVSTAHERGAPRHPTARAVPVINSATRKGLQKYVLLDMATSSQVCVEEASA